MAPRRVVQAKPTPRTRSQRVLSQEPRPDHPSGRVFARRLDLSDGRGRVDQRCAEHFGVYTARRIGCFGDFGVYTGRRIGCFGDFGVHTGRRIGCFGDFGVHTGRRIGCFWLFRVRNARHIAPRRIGRSAFTFLAGLTAEAATLVVGAQVSDHPFGLAADAQEGSDELQSLGVVGVEVAHGLVALLTQEFELLLMVGEIAVLLSELAIGRIETLVPTVEF